MHACILLFTIKNKNQNLYSLWWIFKSLLFEEVLTIQPLHAMQSRAAVL